MVSVAEVGAVPFTDLQWRTEIHRPRRDKSVVIVVIRGGDDVFQMLERASSGDGNAVRGRQLLKLILWFSLGPVKEGGMAIFFLSSIMVRYSLLIGRILAHVSG